MGRLPTVPLTSFAESDIRRFVRACEKHGLRWTDFDVLGLVTDDSETAVYPNLRIRVEYRPTRKIAHYQSGQSMSWIVTFEIDLGAGRYK